MKDKKHTWLKFRHRVIRNIAFAVLAPYTLLKYNISIQRFRGQGKRPWLILLNHQTPFDQFFVGIAFKGPVYYLATEDIFSLGLLSTLLRYALAPIPIKKQTGDVKAVMTCIRVAREGGTIAIAPEGNRTYSGRTEYMNPAIAPLAKRLKLPIALFRIEGGYGAQPRWSDVVRRGKMRAYVSRVVEPEEYAALSDGELAALIEKELMVDEAVADRPYYHKRSAEYLERMAYVCPHCGFSPFESHGDTVECRTCGRKIRYLPTKELQGVGFDFPFPFVGQWYDYQYRFVNGVDTRAHLDTPLFRDSARMSEVIVYKKKNLLAKDAQLALYGDRVEVTGAGGAGFTFPFADVSAVTVLGRNKLNIYHEGRVYQFKGDKRFNALKYVNLCYRHKNIAEGKETAGFLGI